ncbi:hypothetical protein SeMB42_g07731 [Synchytrium endobioticum]|nr:hypothetical protein SeMB42_g07731 [Synchytrium endobioticum]
MVPGHETASNQFPSGSREGYYNSDEVLSFIKNIAANNEHFQYIQAGSSVAGREIGGLFVTSRRNLTIPIADRPVLLIVSALDAQTPLALMASLRLALTLSGNESQPILSYTRLIILPLLNPDGWAKQEPKGGMDTGKSTASTCSSNAEFNGVDLTRNFDSFWDLYMDRYDEAQKALHEDGCSDVYHGPEPFSEPETNAVLSVINNHNPKSLVMLSQLPPAVNYSSPKEWRQSKLVTPFEYSRTWIPSQADQDGGYTKIVNSIISSTPNNTYETNAVTKLEYLRPGSLLDYAFHERGIWAVELVISTVGTDTKSNSIWVNSSEIVSVVQPHLDGILNVASIVPSLPVKASRSGANVGGHVAKTIYYGPLIFGTVLLIVLLGGYCVATYVFKFDNVVTRFRRWWRQTDRYMNRGFTRLATKPEDAGLAEDGDEEYGGIFELEEDSDLETDQEHVRGRIRSSRVR